MALAGAYKLFDQENDVVKNIKATISSGIWSGGASTLTSMFSQSAQSSSTGNYFYDVYIRRRNNALAGGGSLDALVHFRCVTHGSYSALCADFYLSGAEV